MTAAARRPFRPLRSARLRDALRLLRGAGLALLLGAAVATTAREAAAQPDPAEGPQEIVTPKGLSVWLKYEPSLPAVALNAQFGGGGLSADAPDRRGASFLIGGLLEEGAGDLDARSFQNARDELGARIVYMTASEDLSITVWSPSEHLGEVMDLVRLSLASPRFDPEAVALVKAQSTALMRHQGADAQNLAEMAFLKRLFPDDPYSSDYRGGEADYAKLTREDLLEAMPRLTDRDRLIVSAVGDVTPERLAELVDAAFGDLAAGGGAEPAARPDGSGAGDSAGDRRSRTEHDRLRPWRNRERRPGLRGRAGDDPCARGLRGQFPAQRRPARQARHDLRRLGGAALL